MTPPQPDDPFAVVTDFAKLNLSATMLAALSLAGYEKPTPVQAGLIPRALAGVDVMAQARTGTGKTASFAIPILEKLVPHKHSHGPQALVLVPTRELSVQVRDEFVKLAHGRRVHVVAAYGGKPIRGQIDKLKRGADVVVGTPGRVIDLLDRQALQVEHLRIAVLDEADRMLDIGFRPDIENILRRCPASRQTLLLSATVPKEVERLARRYMHENETLNFSANEVSVETIDQYYFTVLGERKFELLTKLLAREEPRQSIVFCRTKKGTERVYTKLSKHLGEDQVGCIHGDLNQRQRDRAMANFREGKIRYLVATDVVGRGIDVSSVSHIINFDIPEFCDDYVHRVGRTGRMGREGVAYTFVTPEEGNELTRIEIRINRLLHRDEIDGVSHHHAPSPTPPSLEAPPAATPGSKYFLSDGSAPTASPPPESVSGVAGKKPPKRYRRAL